MFVSNDVIHDPRVLKEADALHRAGHQVSFIGWDRSGHLPQTEDRDGVLIRRVRTTGFMWLLWKDLFRNPVWWQRAYNLAMKTPFDVVHCHDLDTLPIGVRLKETTGKPLVYDCHEVFHRMIAGDVPRFVTNYAARMERRLVPTADRILVVSQVVADYITEISGRDSLVVANYPDFMVDVYSPPPAKPLTVLYLGNLHPSRFILPAIDVIGAMPDVKLVIAGSKKLAPQVAAMCAERPNTRFLGNVPNNRILPLILDCHVMLSMFDPTVWVNAMGLPNKVFEAMAAGRPSIVTEKGLIAEVVEREQCGFAVPYSRAGFTSAVVALRDEPSLVERLGRNGLKAVRREYNWGREARKLVELYDGLSGRPKA